MQSPPSRVLYAADSSYDEEQHEEGSFLSRSKFGDWISIRIRSNTIQIGASILDKGAGLNLIN